MYQIMTAHQLEFFDKYSGSKDKEKELKFKKWISQGEVDTVEYYNWKKGTNSFAARLRGVGVTNTYPTVKEAKDKALEKQKKYIEETKDVEIDSKALLIDGQSYRESKKYSDLHIEKFVHLGIEVTNGRNDHRFSDSLEDFIGDIGHKGANPYGKLNILQKAILDIDETDDDKDDLIREVITDKGFFGVAIEVNTPTRGYTKMSSGYSFSWGSCYYKWVYGETLEDALSEGQKWADSMHKADKDKVDGVTKKKVTKKKVTKKKVTKKKVTKKKAVKKK